MSVSSLSANSHSSRESEASSEDQSISSGGSLRSDADSQSDVDIRQLYSRSVGALSGDGVGFPFFNPVFDSAERESEKMPVAVGDVGESPERVARRGIFASYVADQKAIILRLGVVLFAAAVITSIIVATSVSSKSDQEGQGFLSNISGNGEGPRSVTTLSPTTKTERDFSPSVSPTYTGSDLATPIYITSEAPTLLTEEEDEGTAIEPPSIETNLTSAPSSRVPATPPPEEKEPPKKQKQKQKNKASSGDRKGSSSKGEKPARSSHVPSGNPISKQPSPMPSALEPSASPTVMPTPLPSSSPSHRPTSLLMPTIQPDPRPGKGRKRRKKKHKSSSKGRRT